MYGLGEDKKIITIGTTIATFLFIAFIIWTWDAVVENPHPILAGVLLFGLPTLILLGFWKHILFGDMLDKAEANNDAQIALQEIQKLIPEFNKQKKVVLKIFEKFNVYKNEFLEEYISADVNVTPNDFYELVKDYSKELKDIGKNENEDYLFQCSQIKSFLVESDNNVKNLHKLIKDWDGGKWSVDMSFTYYETFELTESYDIDFTQVQEAINKHQDISGIEAKYKACLWEWTKEMEENSYFSERDGEYNLNSRLQKRNQSLVNLTSAYKEIMEFYHYSMYLSLNYLLAIINSDIMGANDIYITLDRLNIFNKNWENEVLNKLQNIEDKLDDLISVVEESTKEIVNSINNLSFSITDSLNSLKGKVQETNRLQKWNNLYTAIGSYQTYKLNK
jgi:hypothetical protein